MRQYLRISDRTSRAIVKKVGCIGAPVGEDGVAVVRLAVGPVAESIVEYQMNSGSELVGWVSRLSEFCFLCMRRVCGREWGKLWARRPPEPRSRLNRVGAEW
jgi:hypothetical protein